MADVQVAQSGDWSVADDGLQWILQRRRPADKRPGRSANGWLGVSFVRTTREVLGRCVREKGVPSGDALRLRETLPASHPTWMAPTPEKRLAQPEGEVTA
jgi:hypothetical protein